MTTIGDNGEGLVPRPPSVTDRYFKKFYKTDVLGKAEEDQLILTHSNKVCVVCIADSHPIIAEGKVVCKVCFQGEGWSRQDNTISGKNKRGALWLERSAPLCEVTCTDGSMYVLRCCIKGQLVEINTNLTTNPSLLSSKPSCEGYVAVILPGLKFYSREIERLKSETAYQALVEQRETKQCNNATKCESVENKCSAVTEDAFDKRSDKEGVVKNVKEDC